VPGGSGANQATWLAGEGIGVRFAGRVGRDDLAAQVLELARAGVDARLGADDILPTGQIVVLVSENGERSFFTDRGANLTLCREYLPDTLLDGVDLVSVSGYALFADGPRAAVLALLEETKRRAIPFAVDPASHSFLREAGAESFLAWCAGARFFFPNADEAAILTGAQDPEVQLETLLRRFEVVALKLGTAGAMAGEATSGRRVSLPAGKAAPIDGSGAGDAFQAGFLASYLAGHRPRRGGRHTAGRTARPLAAAA